tara:strand:+ start:192 stop:1349 length:1158 start_codon:yes stop_codon:yes gene_type:complete
MAKKENVVEEVVELVEETNAPTDKTEQGDLVPEVTVKEDGTHKIDFDKLVAKPEKGEVAKKEVKEEVKVEEPVAAVEEIVPEEPSVLEEITEEKIVEKAEEIAEAVVEAQETGRDLPENIQKVVDFMDETGGSLEDYVKLNTDVEALNEEQLLMEYYQNTKPHLDVSEINFLLEDKFSYEDEVDEERDIKRKKLAKKEELANAKIHLNGLKTKYYEEIKAGSKLAPEQKKAVDFFNRYNKNQEVAEKQTKTFNNKTNQVFNDDFKGFEYNVGDKRYRFNVKNPNEIKDKQGNINNFVKKFLDKNNEMEDAAGYHKSLFTAMNPDAIANHFYEQGKSDAMRQSIASTKNISMDPRKAQGAAPKSGTTYKSVDSDGSTVNWGFKKRK